MAKSCKGLAMELVKCLSESDCVKVDNRTYRECAKEKSPSISSECVGLRETYFNCKRGQGIKRRKVAQTQKNEYLVSWLAAAIAACKHVDMRARIRGNKGY